MIDLSFLSDSAKSVIKSQVPGFAGLFELVDQPVDFDSVKTQLAELARQTMSQELGSGYAESKDQITQNYKTLLNGLPESQKQRAIDYYANSLVEATKPFEGQVDSKKTQLLESFKTELKGQLAQGAIGVGAGLFQILDSARKRSGLSAPKLPERFDRDFTIQSELTKAISRADQGNPELTRQFEGVLAEARELDDSRAGAASGGDASKFLANAQGSELRRANSSRDFLANIDQQQANARADVNQLFAIDQGERRAVQRQDNQIFNIEEGRFRTNIAELTAQKNSGLQNLFDGLGATVRSGVGLKSVQNRLEGLQNRVPEAGVAIEESLPTTGVFDDELFSSPTSNVFSDGALNKTDVLLRAQNDPNFLTGLRNQLGIDDVGSFGSRDAFGIEDAFNNNRGSNFGLLFNDLQ